MILGWRLTNPRSSPFEVFPNGSLVVKWTNVTDGNYSVQLISSDRNTIINLIVIVDIPPSVIEIVNPEAITDASVGTIIFTIPGNISATGKSRDMFNDLWDFLTGGDAIRLFHKN